MKEKPDLVRGWMRKTHSDILAMNASLEAGALDACCFHAQQAVEKILKAYLIHNDIEFPFTHNLVKLIELAAQKDEAFRIFLTSAEVLTPYAVELRYDDEFWPSVETSKEACTSATALLDFVLERLPHDIADAALGKDV